MESVSNSEYESKGVNWDWVNTKLPQVVGSFIMIKEFKYTIILVTLWEVHVGTLCQSVSEQQIKAGL